MATLYLTVAIPGAGKSTFAKKFCADNGLIYLSSDGLRAVLGTSEDDQTVSGEVFKYIRNMATWFLRTGQSVLIDATNYNRKNRADLVKIARLNNSWIVAFVFNVPFAICCARNTARARRVPLFVMERMRDGWEAPDENEVDEVISIDENGK